VTTTYVCGPISGYAQANEPVFRQAAEYLKTRDQVPVVPHDLPPMEHEGPCPRSHTAVTTGEHGVACYLRADLVHLLLYCDAVYVLPGWEASVGARLEVMVATSCGIPVTFA
jgi:hypothetical protein